MTLVDTENNMVGCSCKYGARGNDSHKWHVSQNPNGSPGVLALGVGKQDFLMLGTLTSHRLGCNTPNSFNPPVVRQGNLTHRHRLEVHTCTRYPHAFILKLHSQTEILCKRDFVIWRWPQLQIVMFCFEFEAKKRTA